MNVWWKVTTLTNKVLFQGRGPVDRPNKTGSFIRSKLRGFTGPLLLVTMLTKHWGLRHRCKFRCLAGSDAAINQLWTDIQRDFSPTTQPDNIDYLSTIKVLSIKLWQPISTKWVMRHHEGNAWGKTNSESYQKDEAKDFATKSCQNKTAKPLGAIAHK